MNAEAAVVIVGGGPTGMMLAGELALSGVAAIILERRPDQALEGSRALGLNARSLEVLDQRGIADRFMAAGRPAQIHSLAGVPLDLSEFPTRFNHGLALPQAHTGRLLAEWIAELGVEVRLGVDVERIRAGDAGVEIGMAGGGTLDAAWLVGCDGGRSIVRRGAGIGFPGTEPTASWVLAEVDLDDIPEYGLRAGLGGIGPAPGSERTRVVVKEPGLRSGTATDADLRAALMAAEGTHYGLRRIHWLSRFTDATRQAAGYRSGRVFLAGDAAHIHPPQGGQGLNTGLQDAVNLGWKLAGVLDGCPDDLLDTYDAERRPVGARVLRLVAAMVALGRPDGGTAAIGDLVAELLASDQARRALAGRLSGLDIRYDLGSDDPLVGRRMPDLDLVTTAGPTRVHRLLHDARPVLLRLGWTGDAGAGLSWIDDRVTVVDAGVDGPWELPVVGDVAAPDAVLIRPDGHVAWAGDPAAPGLAAALTAWCGPGLP